MDYSKISKELYPRMVIAGDGLSPCVRLPANFREFVPSFYKFGGKEYIEKVARAAEGALAGVMGPSEAELRWDDKLGLRTIMMPPHGGFDLNLDREESGTVEFEPQNLTGHKNGILAFIIATAYVSRLMGNRR